MADNINLNTGSGGDVLSADDIAGVKVQRVKVQWGADGTSKDVVESWPLPVAQASNGTQNVIFSRYLDTNGDGTGTKNANGNYSGGATSFYIQPPASTIYRISRLLVFVQDTNGFTPVEYGNTGSALSNGITVRVHNGTSTVADLTDGVPVQHNGDWARLCYDAQVLSWGTTDEMLSARLTFTKAGQFLRLDGDDTEKLEVILNDDFTGLTEHYFLVQGYTEYTGT